MIEQKYLDVLKEFDTDKNPHSFRKLIDHLEATYNLLKEWGNSEAICLAGLFHSIYGTKDYLVSSAGFSKREYIRQIIGNPAEEWVYLFCVTDRKVYSSHIGKNEIVLKDTFSNKDQLISEATLAALIEIDSANELEQIPDLNNMQEIIVEFIKDRVEAGKPCLSANAYNAWQEVFQQKHSRS